VVAVRRTALLILTVVALQLVPAAFAQTPEPSPSPPPADATPPRITIESRDARVVLGALGRFAPIRASFSEPSSVMIRVTTRTGRRVVQVPTAARLVSEVAARWAGGGARGRLVHPGRYIFVIRARDAAGDGSVKRIPVRALAGSYAASTPLHYTYALEARGVPASAMRDFATVAAATLADMRGWSLRHNVSYDRVASNGSFRLILASPGSVAAASSACSSYWSCRVGSQVLVNLDRWRYATPTWTKSEREYRSFVINHEVGHWLGLGHAGCGGVGLPAPVMMQQSKGTYGCVNNVWPLENERARVAALRGGTAWPMIPLGRRARSSGRAAATSCGGRAGPTSSAVSPVTTCCTGSTVTTSSSGGPAATSSTGGPASTACAGVTPARAARCSGEPSSSPSKTHEAHPGRRRVIERRDCV
jgi:Protein of unknown function (DUF3152)